jgi:hypothetical protein
MRLSNGAGYRAPLLACCLAVLTACAGGTTQKDSSTPPTVTAIYAIDTNLFVGATTAGPKAPQPDVLLYSQTDARVSDKAPASYDGLRIEFSETLDSSTIASPTNLGAASGTTANASFCGPLTGDPTKDPVQVLDVSGANGGPPNSVIPSSVCFNPSSDLGGNPNVIVQIGGSTLNASSVPFTCQSFSRPATGGSNTNFTTYVPNKPYAVKLASTITGSNGQALALPSGGNPSGKWSGGTFAYTSSGFEILAAGFQDDNTGFFTFLNKPSKGFLKDLNAVDASTYRQPATNTSFIVFTTLRVNRAGGVASDAAGNPAITVKRKANGTDFPVFPFLSNLGDRREIFVIPGEDGDANWEPGVEYVLTVAPGLTSTDKALTLGGTGASYDFTVASAPLALTGSFPGPSATSQPLIRDAGPANVNLIGAAPTAYAGLVFQAGIDPATVTAANVVLKDAAGAVVPAAVVPGEDPSIGNPDAQQTIYVTPNANLKPATTYTITTANLKVATGIPGLSGQPIANSSTTFTTENFRIDRVNTEGQKGATPGGTPDILDVTRRTDNDAESVVDGSLKVRFTDSPTAATVTAGNLQLLEGTGSTAPPVAGITVTADPTPTAGQGLAGSATVKAPATYAIKFGQTYSIKAAPAITGPGGVALKAEGCTTGDCSDVRTFTTRAFAPTVTAANTSGSSITVTVKFNYDVDPTTVAPANVNLFKQGATSTSVALSCAGTGLGLQSDKRTFTCKTTAPASLNTNYLATAVFTSPAKVAATTAARSSTNPNQGPFNADQATGQFTGTVSATVLTPCQ